MTKAIHDIIHASGHPTEPDMQLYTPRSAAPTKMKRLRAEGYTHVWLSNVVHYCASPTCPGRSYADSETSHPAHCGATEPPNWKEFES